MWMKVLDSLFNAKWRNFLACWWLYHVFPTLSAILFFGNSHLPFKLLAKYHLLMKIHQHPELYHFVLFFDDAMVQCLDCIFLFFRSKERWALWKRLTISFDIIDSTSPLTATEHNKCICIVWYWTSCSAYRIRRTTITCDKREKNMNEWMDAWLKGC